MRERTVFMERGLFRFFPFLIDPDYPEIVLLVQMPTSLLQKSVNVYDLCLTSGPTRSLIPDTSLGFLFYLIFQISNRAISLDSHLSLFFILLNGFRVFVSFFSLLLFPFSLLSYGLYLIFSFLLLFLSLDFLPLLFSLLL